MSNWKNCWHFYGEVHGLRGVYRLSDAYGSIGPEKRPGVARYRWALFYYGWQTVLICRWCVIFPTQLILRIESLEGKCEAGLTRSTVKRLMNILWKSG